MRSRVLLPVLGLALGGAVALVLHAVVRVDPPGVYSATYGPLNNAADTAYRSTLTVTFDKVPPSWWPLSAWCLLGGLALGAAAAVVLGRRVVVTRR